METAQTLGNLPHCLTVLHEVFLHIQSELPCLRTSLLSYFISSRKPRRACLCFLDALSTGMSGLLLVPLKLPPHQLNSTQLPQPLLTGQVLQVQAVLAALC